MTIEPNPTYSHPSAVEADGWYHAATGDEEALPLGPDDPLHEGEELHEEEGEGAEILPMSQEELASIPAWKRMKILMRKRPGDAGENENWPNF